jgi:hypothetical protein
MRKNIYFAHLMPFGSFGIIIAETPQIRFSVPWTAVTNGSQNGLRILHRQRQIRHWQSRAINQKPRGEYSLGLRLLLAQFRQCGLDWRFAAGSRACRFGRMLLRKQKTGQRLVNY